MTIMECVIDGLDLVTLPWTIVNEIWYERKFYKVFGDDKYVPLDIRCIKEMLRKEKLLRNLTLGGLTLGSGQLIKMWADEGDLAPRLKKLESALEGTPTFGCEFCVEEEPVKILDPSYEFYRSLNLANYFMRSEWGNDIRPCEFINDSSNDELGNKNHNTAEFRMCPSYAPITATVVNEMFEYGILPKNVLMSYAVNMVGDGVLDLALPLILVNCFTGLTPNLPSLGGEYSFRDVHVYKGATVDKRTGKLTRDIQLNINAGVTGRVVNNPQLAPFKSQIEGDVDERLYRMLAPFLVSKKIRREWAKAVYDSFDLDRGQIIRLQGKLDEAVSDCNVWKTGNDIRIYDSIEIRGKIEQVYRELERSIQHERPKVYRAIQSLGKGL